MGARLKVRAGEWERFGSDSASGPMGLSRALVVGTDLGLQVHTLHLGYFRRSHCPPLPLLMIETNVRLMEQNGHDWLIVELLSTHGSILAFPAEVFQSDALTALLNRSHSDVREVAARLATSDTLKISIRDPAGELAGFLLPPSRSFFPLYRSVLDAVRAGQGAP